MHDDLLPTPPDLIAYEEDCVFEFFGTRVRVSARDVIEIPDSRSQVREL